MHALIIVTHPNSDSLTHSIAREVARGVAPPHTTELVDLAASDFDPRFTQADIAVLHGAGGMPTDVLAEQVRIDKATALVLVYPIYWWSMPALLKGWIDRVFVNGWAFDSADGKLSKKLQRLEVHLIALGGADPATYERHGYQTAMTTQIEHGIFDYCGARVVSSTLMLDADTQDPALHLKKAAEIGGSLLHPGIVHPDE